MGGRGSGMELVVISCLAVVALHCWGSALCGYKDTPLGWEKKPYATGGPVLWF